MSITTVIGDAAVPPALETLYREHESTLDHIHDLYELDITNRMKAEGIGGTPHFKRRADNPAVYARTDIQMGFIFFRRGYMTGLVAKVRSVEKLAPTPFHKPT